MWIPSHLFAGAENPRVTAEITKFALQFYIPWAIDQISIIMPQKEIRNTWDAVSLLAFSISRGMAGAFSREAAGTIWGLRGDVHTVSIF